MWIFPPQTQRLFVTLVQPEWFNSPFELSLLPPSKGRDAGTPAAPPIPEGHQQVTHTRQAGILST